jgi:hypothetical protein
MFHWPSYEETLPFLYMLTPIEKETGHFFTEFSALAVRNHASDVSSATVH